MATKEKKKKTTSADTKKFINKTDSEISSTLTQREIDEEDIISTQMKEIIIKSNFSPSAQNNINQSERKIDNNTPKYNNYENVVTTTNNVLISENTQYSKEETGQKNLLCLPKYDNKTQNVCSTIDHKVFSKNEIQKYFCCKEIDIADQFEIELLNNTLLGYFENSLLKNLLEKYSKACSNFATQKIEVDTIKYQIDTQGKGIWYEEIKIVEGEGVCGDNLTVKSTMSYNVMVLNNGNLQCWDNLLTQLHELLYGPFTASAIHCKILQTKIEQLIRSILLQNKFTDINSDSNIRLFSKDDLFNDTSIDLLRTSISTLFSFTRRPSAEKNFLNDVKTWLKRLIAVLLRKARSVDHWFILHHILRCPSGITSWAISFIQIPNWEYSDNEENFEQKEIKHCLSFLHILLKPVKSRTEFFSKNLQNQYGVSDPIKDDIWILVDSDGEEENSKNFIKDLGENDLIALLNQVPFDKLFSSFVSSNLIRGLQCSNINAINASKLIRLIAFSSELVNIFGKGLATFNTVKYKNFAKRLGRLLSHTLQYTADFYEIYLNNEKGEEQKELQLRVDIELNALILRSCWYIYNSQNLGNWQYLTLLPFSVINKKTLWKLFHFLNVGFPDEMELMYEEINVIDENTFWENFNMNISETSAENIYYLLQSFTNMILKHEKKNEFNFIKYAGLHIFRIGFENVKTRDNCCRTSRDMLINISSMYPEIISEIICYFNNKRDSCENIIYLFKSLPLDKWKPFQDIYKVLSDWLLSYSLTSNENILARIIISNLNLNFNCNGELFLARDVHFCLACIIFQASVKHVCDTKGFLETFLQVSVYSETKNLEENFYNWCWNIIFKLHLHHFDQDKSLIQSAIDNPSVIMFNIPELEKVDVIYQGVSESKSLAIFLSIAMTNYGHTIPLICQKSFRNLKILIKEFRYLAIIRILEFLTPFFSEYSDVLTKCEEFLDLLKLLTSCDRSYIKMAKSFITSSSCTPILNAFGDMLQAQIINYKNYFLPSPKNLIILWLNVLTQEQNWPSTASFFLVDVILQIAYQFPEAWASSKDFFFKFYESTFEIKPTKGTFKLLISTSNSSRNIPSIPSEYAYLGLLTLEIEHKLYERNSRLWPELLVHIRDSDPKTSIDNILKKISSVIGCPFYSSTNLVLYKYINFIIFVRVDHPLLPILCQQFFSLYLERVPVNNYETSLHEFYGVAEKFYNNNIAIMKKLKNFLIQIKEYYILESSKSNSKDDNINFINNKRVKIFNSYLLWLEETSLDKISKCQYINLPPQFNIEKLQAIFSGKEQHWTEFIHLRAIRNEQKECAKRWLKTCFRYFDDENKTSTTFNTINDYCPKKAILARLKSYDNILGPPNIQYEPLIFKSFSLDNINAVFAELLKDHFQIIENYAREYTVGAVEFESVKNSLKECICQLYFNVEYNKSKEVKCSSIFAKSSFNCSRPARIIFQIEESNLNQVIQQNIILMSEKYNEMIEQKISYDYTCLTTKMEEIICIIGYLLNFRFNQSQEQHQIKIIDETAIEIFHKTIQIFQNHIEKCPTTNNWCNNILSQLKPFIQFNQETQALNLLESAFNRPKLIELFSELFNPSEVRPKYFISLYKFLIDSHIRNYDANIIFLLISKFDLSSWLENHHPKLSEISQLIELILLGLKAESCKDSSNLQQIFQTHLINIFEYNFPEHYGEILQAVLTKSSESNLNHSVIIELMNSLFLRSKCNKLEVNHNPNKTDEEIKKFVVQQNLLNFNSIVETMNLFAKHFHNERLKVSSAELYSKYEEFCLSFAFMFSIYGQIITYSAICTYYGEFADKLCDIIFAPLVGMFAPWLIPYDEEYLNRGCVGKATIIQNINPWSPKHKDLAKLMIGSFLKCVQFMLDSMPVSTKVLSHILNWYKYHFVKTEIDFEVKITIHSELIKLPWKKFKPLISDMEILCKILRLFIPECHAFIGYLFLQIQWTPWLNELLVNINTVSQSNLMSFMHCIFVYISFEPQIHDNPQAAKILEEAFNYPWHLVGYDEIANTFEWFIVSAEPVVILKVPSETNATDIAVIELLKYSSGLIVNNKQSNLNNDAINSKRLLYVKSIVRMLRTCVSKNQKLMATKEGSKYFREAVIELILAIQEVINSFSSSIESERLGRDLFSEIISSLSFHNETISKLFVDSIIYWQSNYTIEGFMCRIMLSALGLSKSMTLSMYSLIEVIITNYFSLSGGLTSHNPSWNEILLKLGQLPSQMNILVLIQSPFLLTLHVLILKKFHDSKDIGEQVLFLKDLSQLLENIKSIERFESQIVLVWGSIISFGLQIFEKTDNNYIKKVLLMLAKYLQRFSSPSDGWGQGILSVIGLNKQYISKKRSITAKCLSCLIFSMIPEENMEKQVESAFEMSFKELKSTVLDKKFGEFREMIERSLELIQDRGILDATKIVTKVCNIISLFYEENIFNEVNSVWSLY